MASEDAKIVCSLIQGMLRGNVEESMTKVRTTLLPKLRGYITKASDGLDDVNKYLKSMITLVDRSSLPCSLPFSRMTQIIRVRQTLRSSELTCSGKITLLSVSVCRLCLC